MKKRKFLLFFGFGWCGTTSLWHTLIKNNYYEAGIRKELFNFTLVDDYYRFGFIDPTNFFKNNKKHKTSYYNELNYDQNLLPSSVVNAYNKIKIDIDEYGYDNFAKEYLNEDQKFFNLYIDYLNVVSNTTNCTSIGDFSNSNAGLSISMLNKIKKTLELHDYEIKTLCILRDPIRSDFSKFNAWYYANNKNIPSQKYIDNHFSRGHSNFVDIIKKYQSVFGEKNVHYVIMEDFFNPEKREGLHSVTGLENYLNHKLPIIHPCVFVPDKGINAPKIDGLKDQWDCDKLPLTPEKYNEYRLSYKKQYDDFQEMHQSLPADWGIPIDYGYDQ